MVEYHDTGFWRAKDIISEVTLRPSWDLSTAMKADHWEKTWSRSRWSFAEASGTHEVLKGSNPPVPNMEEIAGKRTTAVVVTVVGLRLDRLCCETTCSVSDLLDIEVEVVEVSDSRLRSKDSGVTMWKFEMTVLSFLVVFSVDASRP